MQNSWFGGVILKLTEFLKLMLKYFKDCIQPDDPMVSKRVNNANILTTILSWFVVDSTMPLEGIEPGYAGKIIRGEENISKANATLLLGKIDFIAFQEVWDNKEMVDSVIDSFIADFSSFGVIIRKGYECEDTSLCLQKIYADLSSTPKKEPIRKAKIINGQVIIVKKIIPLPEGLKTPTAIADEEAPYVDALLRVYAQNEKKPSITLEDLDTLTPFYTTHFRFQRDAFYSAESVRRAVRDIFSDGIDAFDELKQETYDGIQHLMLTPYKNGYERLTKVISFVSTPGFYTKSFLASAGNGLVGIKEKTGLLHILVNEEGVDWVVDYDTDI